MKQKQTIRLNENQLHKVLNDVMKKVLKETRGDWDIEFDENGYITNLPEDVAEWGAKCQQLGAELSDLCAKYHEAHDLYQMLITLDEELNAVNGDLNTFSIASHWMS